VCLYWEWGCEVGGLVCVVEGSGIGVQGLENVGFGVQDGVLRIQCWAPQVLQGPSEPKRCALKKRPSQKQALGSLDTPLPERAAPSPPRFCFTCMGSTVPASQPQPAAANSRTGHRHRTSTFPTEPCKHQSCSGTRTVRPRGAAPGVKPDPHPSRTTQAG
jgi:hypothetical protein